MEITNVKLIDLGDAAIETRTPPGIDPDGIMLPSPPLF